MNNSKDIDVLILCGGKGTRLNSVVSDRPKVLADINGKPFLKILIENLYLYGFRNIILCTGHMKEQFHNEKIDELLHNHNDLNIILSEETKPLGTGGAIKNAEPLINSETFLVLNGDSFCNINYNIFIKYHNIQESLLSIVTAYEKHENGYGNIILSNDGRIINFNEKVRLINTGIYLTTKKIFQYMPEGNFSLENDFIPTILGFNCYGYITYNHLIDIGTPERYKTAIEYFKK